MVPRKTYNPATQCLSRAGIARTVGIAATADSAVGADCGRAGDAAQHGPQLPDPTDSHFEEDDDADRVPVRQSMRQKRLPKRFDDFVLE